MMEENTQNSEQVQEETQQVVFYNKYEDDPGFQEEPQTEVQGEPQEESQEESEPGVIPEEQPTGMTKEQVEAWGLPDSFIGKPIDELGWQHRKLLSDYTQKSQRLTAYEKGLQQTQQPPKDEKPVKPQKPANYKNLQLEAITDPDGRAAEILAQYEDAKDQYQNDLLDWRVSQVEKKYKPLEDHYKTVQESEAEKQQRQQIVGQFNSKVGDMAQAVKYAEFALSEEFTDMDNIIKFFHVIHGDGTPNKAKDYSRRNARTDSALPPGTSVQQPVQEKSLGQQQIDLSKTMRI
jgi:hypothetical protein